MEYNVNGISATNNKTAVELYVDGLGRANNNIDSEHNIC